MISMSLSRAAAAIDAIHVGDDVTFHGCNTDTRTIEPDSLFIALQGDNFDGHDFVDMAEQKRASSLMLSRQVAHSLPALMVDDTRKSMGLLAKHWREQLDIPMVAITGSNGKTTVKEMVKSILSTVASVHATSGNFNNDIGVPLTLFAMDTSHHYAVIEMGANHLGEIEWLSAIAQPNVAVITQCAPAHLEGFGSIEGVARAKSEIFSGLKPGGTAVINADDNYAGFWLDKSSQHDHVSFGIETEQADIRAIDIDSDNEMTRFTLLANDESIVISLPLLGRHNVMNALAAAACCISLDIPLTSIQAGLRSMTPVKGRLQIKRGYQNSKIIDDTYNANPVSLNAAIKVLASYQGKRIMVLGDMGELGDDAKTMHANAGKQALEMGIDALYTLGELSQFAHAAFGKHAQHHQSHDALIGALKQVVDDNTTILVKGSRAIQMERIVNALTEEQ